MLQLGGLIVRNVFLQCPVPGARCPVQPHPAIIEYMNVFADGARLGGGRQRAGVLREGEPLLAAGALDRAARRVRDGEVRRQALGAP